MIGASSCLCGISCRYDGKANTVPDIEDLYKAGKVVDICPEVLGGLPTPRIPSEIVGGIGNDVWDGNAPVMSKTGVDVTEAFKNGAIAALVKLQAQNVTKVILKERSPSCGTQFIYDGSFGGIRIPGCGVTAAHFKAHGLILFSEENYKGNV
jgi:uncharacterized protein YbbK (DUF523 family)